jgi:hypothetical protein
VAGRRMAQPIYPQLRKYPCVRALTFRANNGSEKFLDAASAREFAAVQKSSWDSTSYQACVRQAVR